MGRELRSGNSSFKTVATINYKDKGTKPGKFVGKFIGVKVGVGQFNQKVYSFEAIDGDLPTVIKIEGVYVPVDINVGDTVEIWGCTTLNQILTRETPAGAVEPTVNPGEKVELVFEGLLPSKVKGRKPFYAFSAAVID